MQRTSCSPASERTIYSSLQCGVSALDATSAGQEKNSTRCHFSSKCYTWFSAILQRYARQMLTKSNTQRSTSAGVIQKKWRGYLADRRIEKESARRLDAAFVINEVGESTSAFCITIALVV